MVLNKHRASIPLRISIPFTSLWACDVFLSCEHEDIFSDHLYHKLQSRGISVFHDGQGLQRNTTPVELFGAIEESRFAVIVLSQNYASSPRRLNELLKTLECMKDRNRILPVFRDVNLVDVQKQKGTFEKAFDKHEERFQDDLEKVQAWRDALTKVCNFAGWTTNDRNEVQVIEEITEALWNKLHSRISPTEKLQPTSTHNLVAFTSISVNEDYRDHNHPIHITDVTATSVEWNFLITNLGLEILSAAFDQASSSRKPHYALFGMLFSIAALFTCIWELIYKGIKNRVVLKKFGKLWWFYYPHPHNSMPFGTLPEIYGLIGSIAQCICSITQYIYFSWHADSPIKLSLLPAIFLFCLAGSRLNKNQNHC
ncbi:uncharacterized protein LOC133736306 isoform X1 [Rosa rugosa]|uniref:uncharacterized protein LOC133736306 isoform X1 n=1 Tax=Rosa rugosa TaxID=74645 RepID=UPI002B412074|nr:uncharacterized protein LOC133736306 isoform X1 [Rosa rugosa]